MLVALLVLARRELRGHPVLAVAPRIERGHVDLGLALDHHLREIVADAARGGDSERQALDEPHVAQPRRRADQRVAVGRVADRPVEVVLEPRALRGRNAVDHRHVLGFDPLEVEREQIRAEAVGHAVLEARGRAALVGPQDPAAALLAHVPLGVGVAQDRMLAIAVLAEGDQLGIRLGDDVLVLDRHRGQPHAEQPGGALDVVAGGGDDMLRRDRDPLLARDQVSAPLDHRGQPDLPVVALPFVGIGLPSALDRHAALPRALGHRHGDVGGVYVAVGRVVDRPDEVVGAHQRPALLDLRGRQPLVGHAAGLRRGGVEHVLVHALARLRHAQVPDHRKPGVQPGLLLERLVEVDGVFVDVRRGVGHVEQRKQPGGVPGGSGGQLVALNERHPFPARAGEMVGDGGARGAAADHKGLGFTLHGCVSLIASFAALSQIPPVAVQPIRPIGGQNRHGRGLMPGPARESPAPARAWPPGGHAPRRSPRRARPARRSRARGCRGRAGRCPRGRCAHGRPPRRTIR